MKTTIVMQRYDIIAVNVRITEGYGYLEDKLKEVEAYLYGRSFFLDYRPYERGAYDLFFLVDADRKQAIIDRLASGLLWARSANPEEYEELGF